jgi:O-antigen/teichoic acid export membrane protein
VADARLRRDVAWNLAPVVLLAGVGLGINFAIAGWWNAEALAVFNLVTTAYFVLAVIGAFGIQFSVLRAVAEAPGDRARVAAVVVGGLVPAAGLAIVAALACVALHGPVARLHGSAEVGDGMIVVAPGVICFALNKVLLGVVNGLRRMRAFAIYTSLRYVLLGGAVVGAHAIHASAADLPAVWSVSEGALLVVLAGELVATVAVSRCAGWRTWAREHLGYGGRGVVATLFYEINTKLDVWMLRASGIDLATVGVFGLAAALNEGATQLAVVVQTNLDPLLAAGDDLDGLVRRTRRWFVPSFVAACALGALLFPLIIPRLVGDASFAAGTWPFAVMMTGLALASPYLPFTHVLLMRDRPGWHTAYIALVVGVNFIAQLVLIPRLGSLGAGTATALTVVVSAAAIRSLSARHAGVRL